MVNKPASVSFDELTLECRVKYNLQGIKWGRVMGDHVDRHHQMVDAIAGETGLDRTRVELILYAGEPWPETERISGLMVKAFQDAEHSGSDPYATLDALASLLKMDADYKALDRVEGRVPGGGLELEKKMRHIAGLVKEPVETVYEVVRGMMNFYYKLLKKPGEEGD